MNVPVVVESNVISFPAVPVAVNVVTVCVVAAVNLFIRAISDLKSLNVFDHATIKEKAHVVAFQRL